MTEKSVNNKNNEKMAGLKIVTKIERTLCENLRGVISPSKNKIYLLSTIKWDDVCICKKAKLTTTTKLDSNNTVFEHKLVFRSVDDADDNKRRYAYKITLSDGTQLLIGSDERPYPVCALSIIASSVATDDMLLETTVTWNVPHEAYIICNR